MITAAEAQGIINADISKLNNSRSLPVTPRAIRQLLAENLVYICNVGPWAFRPEMGCLIRCIPAYDAKLDPEHKGYVIAEPLPIVHRYAKILNEDEFIYAEDDGHDVAENLIGVGFMLHPMNSLVPYGVFVPRDGEPTPAELAAARKALDDTYNRLIADARDAFDQGPEQRKAVIDERHLLAARVKGIDEKWVHHHAEESVRCTSCGQFNPAGVAKCRCGMIIDFDLHFKNEDEQRRRLAEYEERQTRPSGPPERKK
jgi:hypothetical protein